MSVHHSCPKRRTDTGFPPRNALVTLIDLRALRARSRLRVGPHALAKGMLEGLPYVAILLLLLLLVLFLILLFIFFFPLCASRLSTRQSKVDGTLGRIASAGEFIPAGRL